MEKKVRTKFWKGSRTKKSEHFLMNGNNFSGENKNITLIEWYFFRKNPSENEEKREERKRRKWNGITFFFCSPIPIHTFIWWTIIILILSLPLSLSLSVTDTLVYRAISTYEPKTNHWKIFNKSKFYCRTYTCGQNGWSKHIENQWRQRYETNLFIHHMNYSNQS